MTLPFNFVKIMMINSIFQISNLNFVEMKLSELANSGATTKVCLTNKEKVDHDCKLLLSTLRSGT